jgi:hypothetical protein
MGRLFLLFKNGEKYVIQHKPKKKQKKALHLSNLAVFLVDQLNWYANFYHLKILISRVNTKHQKNSTQSIN